MSRRRRAGSSRARTTAATDAYFADLVAQRRRRRRRGPAADALVPRGARILDIGSGMGRVAAELRGSGAPTSSRPSPTRRCATSRGRRTPTSRSCPHDALALDPAELGAFDLVVLVGNVMIFLAEGTERSVLAAAARPARPERPGARGLPPAGGQGRQPHLPRRRVRRRRGGGRAAGRCTGSAATSCTSRSTTTPCGCWPLTRRPGRDRAAQRGSNSSSASGVEARGPGSGSGCCLRASLTSECAPQPWSTDDHAAVVVGVAVGADAERSRQRPGEPDQEAAGPAAVGRALGQRRVRAAVAGVPALGGHVDALAAQGADAAQAEVLGHAAHLRPGVAVDRASSGSSPKR